MSQAGAAGGVSRLVHLGDMLSVRNGSGSAEKWTSVSSWPAVCDQRLQLKCDEPLSCFAFNFNSRRYTEQTNFEERKRGRGLH